MISREEIRKKRNEIFGNKDKPQEQLEENNPVVEDNSGIDPELLAMFPPKRLAKIMKKELRRYREAQKKKWARWFQAVSK